MACGIYISVPFCKTKCSYCNFASDVFSRVVFERYVDRVCAEIAHAMQIAQEMGYRPNSVARSLRTRLCDTEESGTPLGLRGSLSVAAAMFSPEYPATVSIKARAPAASLKDPRNPAQRPRSGTGAMKT